MAQDESKRRVLLKLSGEAFGDDEFKGHGLHIPTLREVAAEIAEAVQVHKIQVAIVCGGGNQFRGAELAKQGVDRSRADYMGMLGTVINAIALQDFLDKAGAETRVQSAITMGQVAEPYVPRRAIRHLEKGRVVIFAAGLGAPFFSTDTTCVQRALEIGASEVLVAKNGVDGVYNDDPRTNPQAKMFVDLSFTDAIAMQLKVMDGTAFTLALDNDLPLSIFDMSKAGNITQALIDSSVGTRVAKSVETSFVE
ncbi:MAG: UMP kinase [Candidatus Saccharibacteria bacterium]